MEDSPPSVLRKRKRSWMSTEVKSAQEVIERHVEVEIMLRRRALEAANAKIRWAETMRQAVVERVSQRTSVENNPGNKSFLAESARALAAIERLQPLRRPHLRIPLPERTREPSMVAAPALDSGPVSVTLQHSFNSSSEESGTGLPKGMPKPLFIQQDSNSSTEPVTVLISCEVCGRSDFSTIHSVLSHARMSHAIYYRGHEELVGRCGRIVTGAEAERIRRHGTEASSRILLGMRSVIERGISDAQGGDATLLTKTLGLHADSAALASFLGRKPQTHSIRVYEPEGDIDIETVDHDLEAQQLHSMRQKTATTVRRRSQTFFDDLPGGDMELADVVGHHNTPIEPPIEHSQAPVASRFHLKRRLIITDSSHFVSERDRPHPEQTHQWMITVSAPSYVRHELKQIILRALTFGVNPQSQHITTFVSELTVCCVEGQSSLARADDAHIAQQPPFSVIGFASEPFLARVRLNWVGGLSKPLVVPHWVRLDASRLSRTVVGEDQTLDVELDRNTPFRSETHTVPLRFTTRAVYHSPSEENHRRLAPTSASDSTEEHGDPSFDKRLVDLNCDLEFNSDKLLYLEPTIKILLPKIPMTSQDLRARAVEARTVSYSLPRSLNELFKLEHGRRKAYEWRHALSLKWSLIKHAETDAILSNRIADIKKLSTGALYRWMDAHEIFPRPDAPAVQDPGAEMPLDSTFCRFCGLTLDSHPEKLEEPSVPIEDRIDGVVYDPPFRKPVLCSEVDRLPAIHRPPLINSHHWFDSAVSCSHVQSSAAADAHSRTRVSYRDLVRWTNPELVRYARDLTDSFHLPTFDALSTRPSQASFSPGQVGVSSAETDEMLGAHALLGQCLRIVVKQLVHCGVDAARSLADQVRTRRRTEMIAQAFALGDPFPSMPESNDTTASKQVLTPSHILKGLSAAASHLRAPVEHFGETELILPKGLGRPGPRDHSGGEGGTLGRDG